MHNHQLQKKKNKQKKSFQASSLNQCKRRQTQMKIIDQNTTPSKEHNEMESTIIPIEIKKEKRPHNRIFMQILKEDSWILKPKNKTQIKRSWKR